ncbi:hypothetical protein Tco_0776565 [Tanacetum coccineum]
MTEMQEVILFYNGLEVPTRQILDYKSAIPTKTKLRCKALQAQLNNLGREIKKADEKVYVLKWDVSNVRDPTTPKTVHSKKKVKTLKKLIILNLVAPLSTRKANIEQLKNSGILPKK